MAGAVVATGEGQGIYIIIMMVVDVEGRFAVDLSCYTMLDGPLVLWSPATPLKDMVQCREGGGER